MYGKSRNRHPDFVIIIIILTNFSGTFKQKCTANHEMFGFINIDRDTNDLFRIRVIWAFERFPGKLKTLTVSIKKNIILFKKNRYFRNILKNRVFNRPAKSKN